MSKITLDKSGLRKLEKKLGSLRKLDIKVGVLQGKGASEDRDGITMAELAAIHEYGSPKAGIPSRSFLRETFKKAKVATELKLLYAQAAEKILQERTGNSVMLRELGRIGLWGVSKVQERIRKRIPPKLKPATIKRKTVNGKKGDIPLINSGRLINSIQWEVKQDL